MLVPAMFIVGLFVLFTVLKFNEIKPVYAAAGDVAIVVNNELGTSLTGATVSATIACTGGADFTAIDGGANDADTTANGIIVFSAASIGDATTAECDDGEAFTNDIVVKDGYVTENTTLTIYAVGAQNNATTTLDFSHKAIVVNELGAALTPDSAIAGLAWATTCNVVVNAVYCPVPLANDNVLDDTTSFAIVKNGYVTAVPFLAANRTAGTDAQALVTLVAGTGLDFSHKVIVKDELASALTPTTVNAGASLVACTVVANAAYCPVVLLDDNDTALGFVAVKDGYVTTTAADVPLAGNRTSDTYIQQVTTMTVTNGLDFSHKVVVKNELNGSLEADAVTAGANDTPCTVDGSFAYCPVPLADDDAPGATTAYAIAKDGYVSAAPNLQGSRSDGTDAQQVVTLDATTGLDFAFFLAGVTDELSNALSSITVTAGDSYATTCTESNGWYCPVPLADVDLNAKATKDGYVTTDNFLLIVPSDRTDAADPQVMLTDIEGMPFAYKITGITSETLAADLTATATSVRVGDDTGLSTCTFDTDSWYCPVVLANSNGTMVARVYQDGYVQKDTYALTTGSTRLLNTTAQKSDTVADIQYGVRVEPVSAVSSAAISGAAITTGDLSAVTCDEDGTTGIYFCVMPLADTDTVVKVIKSGYRDASNDFTDRTATTDAQVVVAVSMGGAITTGGGGGGGGVYTPPTTPTTPTVTEPENNNPARTDIVTRITQEKNMLLGQANPEAYFINNGTESTLGLGSGERGAAVSSFKEAYGGAPTSESNWIDVLNIANGRWPLGVKKDVEARAYTNFKLVYGRNANMKNSTDVNALKMMGYGVRATSDRNLTSEKQAIAKFKAIFKFNPTTARQWNIMRAIAYSGVVK